MLCAMRQLIIIRIVSASRTYLLAVNGQPALILT